MRVLMRVLSIVLLGLICFSGRADERPGDSPRWYKGNTHAHSLWSDGDEFPEMVADWYKSHGYDFLAISDHNCLMAGEKWGPVDRGTGFTPWDPADPGKGFVPSSVVNKCQQRFGADWVATRQQNGNREVKLKTYEEIRAKLVEPGRFLLIQNEEVTGGVGDHNIHFNTINLAEVLMPKTGRDVAETISLNLAMVQEQSERMRRPILAQVNHPNYEEYDVTAEDLAEASAAKFFEVCNAYPGGHHFGDATHPGVEKLWDIANTIRIAKMKAPPLYGIGADDAHNYQSFSPVHANPGRAWIMVRAKELSAEALIDAISRGDFYASTGVTLRKLAYDAKGRTLAVEVQSEPGISYTIEFIGTPEGVDPKGEPVDAAAGDNQKSKRPGRKYSPEVGKILSRVQGTSATYALTGTELYVRAVVRSDKPIGNAPAGGPQKQEAWCQPVGWKH
jgi:hypothetical protein